MIVPSRVDGGIDAASLHTLLRLALGLPQPSDRRALPWESLLARAGKERLLGVIWRNNGETISRYAPPSVALRWHRQAITLGLFAEAQLSALAVAVAALRKASVSAVVLKGFPLAQQLYGDYTVRPVTDCDLHVPLGQRATAARVLRDIGWSSVSGVAPEEETFERRARDRRLRLEVHSLALDDPLLGHISFDIEQHPVNVGGHELPAHYGRFVFAYLAVHLAKHNEKPALWVLDFFLLWSRLGDDERRQAMTAAREVGLERHLRWAARIAECVDACRLESAAARRPLRHLERALRPTGNAGRMFRLMLLSENPRDVARVIGGRIWPSARRQGWRSAPQYFAQRLSRWTYRRLGVAPRRQLMYVFDFGSSMVGGVNSSVEFRELRTQEVDHNQSSLTDRAMPAIDGDESGYVVGMLSGRKVYRVQYVRGDGARLRGAPNAWQPHGRVLFLHDGYTEPEFRKRGIHTAALKWMLSRECNSSVAHAIGVVHIGNVAARRAVESAGFRCIGTVE